MAESAPPLILASTSATRIAMLRAAGLTFEAVGSGVDETRITREMANAGGTDAAALAVCLAAAKAEAVSLRYADALVIGADQTLECDGRLFDKPADMAMARRHLQQLRGQTHTLHSAVALARHGEIVWSHIEVARLAMWAFDDRFLDDYLAHAGDTVLSSVGCYQIEGLGAQLFERIDGDHFTILGLPLLELLAELRRHQMIAT